jgi:rhamnosyltransferase subunit B
MTRNASIVLSTHGSLGDLHPLMALALALKARGADAVIASHGNFRSKVEAAGLPFLDYGPSYDDYRRDLGITQAELVRRMSRDHAFMLKELVAPYLTRAVDDLMGAVAQSDIVVGSCYAYGAHIAACLNDKPYAAVALQPAVLLSAYDPPHLKNAFFALQPRSAVGRTRNRIIKAIGTMQLAPGLLPIRKAYLDYGLPPQDGIAGIVSSQTMALYSDLIGDIQPDFPPNTQILGFPFFDSESGCKASLRPDLEAFLNAGDAPVVFSLGSVAIFDSERFYREAIKACKALKARCVILAGDNSPLMNEDFGPSVFVTPYAPHSLLFPRSKVLVHHGGIGSTAQALKSGRPQLITPVFADQFDNALRMMRLGCGLSLDFNDWTHERATQLLGRIINTPNLAENAASVAPLIAAENGAERAADIILEDIAARRGHLKQRAIA